METSGKGGGGITEERGEKLAPEAVELQQAVCVLHGPACQHFLRQLSEL